MQKGIDPSHVGDKDYWACPRATKRLDYAIALHLLEELSNLLSLDYWCSIRVLFNWSSINHMLYYIGVTKFRPV